MSNEWVEEMEHSSEAFQICTPSPTIQCQICRTMVKYYTTPWLEQITCLHLLHALSLMKTPLL
jgi:hypothetical protein